MAADIRSALHRLLADRDAQKANQGGFREHRFIQPVYGPGEITDGVQCVFGMAFVQPPSFHHDVQMMAGDAVVGTPPTATASVRHWGYTLTGLIIAARVDITVFGHARQRLNLCLLFSGDAVPFPLGHELLTTNSQI